MVLAHGYSAIISENGDNDIDLLLLNSNGDNGAGQYVI